MKILFIHQNFPGQFKHLAPALAAQGHEVSRPVKTVSAVQVRQGIYQTSKERWKPYEKYLQPLIEALGDVL
jgi:hypothetical protein